MKLFKVFPLLGIALLACACGSARYTASGVSLDDIDQFALLHPYAYVKAYDAHNKVYYDGPDSKIATNMITGIIESERFPFTETIPVAYEDDQTDDLSWITNLPWVDAKKTDRLRVPKDFTRLIKESGCRYGVVVYARGFIRSREALQREAILRGASMILNSLVEERTGVRNVTNSAYNVKSAPYGNDMYLAVIDAEEERVVYFVKEISPFYSHPTNGHDVNALVHKVLKPFVR